MSVFPLTSSHLSLSLCLSVSPPPPPPPGLILSDLYHHLYFCSSVVKFLSWYDGGPVDSMQVCQFPPLVSSLPVFSLALSFPSSPLLSFLSLFSLAGQPLRKREEGSGIMPIRDLYRYSQECSPIRSLHVTTNIVWLLVCRPTNQSLPCVLTNQVLDLHEAGDHNNLLKTKSRHLIGQYEYLDSSTILVVTWRDLIGLHSWLQR